MGRIRRLGPDRRLWHTAGTASAGGSRGRGMRLEPCARAGRGYVFLLRQGLEVWDEIGGVDRIGACGILRGQPVKEEVSDEEFVSGHVPEQEGAPDVACASRLGELDQRAVSAIGLEASMQHL